MYEAIFFDMDSTLIVTKSGNKFPLHNDDWVLNSNIKNKILEFNSKYKPKIFLIVSNQGQLKDASDQELLIFFRKMNKVGEAAFPAAASFDYMYSHKNDNMRKPNIGMAQLFADKYNLNLNNCIMVGDASDKKLNFSDSDKMFAINSGMDYLDINDFLNIKFI